MLLRKNINCFLIKNVTVVGIKNVRTFGIIKITKPDVLLFILCFLFLFF